MTRIVESFKLRLAAGQLDCGQLNQQRKSALTADSQTFGATSRKTSP